ncbi:MAG: cytidine deaminase [Deinococcus sp.]|nr:cytidine deaminase [Deinococcus sp.]
MKPRLVSEALAVRQRAYAPYSRFLVGAAILSNGQVFVGCNVENASFGLTCCAEQMAVGAMVAAGQRRIDLIAIAADPLATPCGACRQILAEFGLEALVILVDPHGHCQETTVRELLPQAFQLPLKP